MLLNEKLARNAMVLLVISFVLVSGTASFVDGGNSHSRNDYTINQAMVNDHSQNFLNSQTSQPVNPFSLYQNEPAPMGIADYGIGSNNQPYSYHTNSFLGIAHIHSFKAYNASLNQSSSQMGFQLNINLVFYNGKTLFVYWVQNVAIYDTSSSSIIFLDNVWNSSANNTSVLNSTLYGNGTIGNSSGRYFYYDFANASLPGNNISLKAQPTIMMMVNATNSVFGEPELVFEYNDGYGWQTYDNVILYFASNLNDYYGFLVDGYTYEPTGYTFYDAEMIMGGPGGGSQTYDVNSSIVLQLEYYNGNNYQTVTNAYNFGSDTAEGISNVISSAEYYLGNGSLFAYIQNGSGILGQMYNSLEIGTINMLSALSSGYLVINGTTYNFVGGDVNVTLSPGKYTLALYDSSGSLVTEGNVTLAAGQSLTLLASDLFIVQFQETGLRLGTNWNLSLSNGLAFSSNSSTITAYLPNGTYIYVAIAGALYETGSLVVSGSNLIVNVSFFTSEYKVTFTERGLPSGELWSVTLGSGFNDSTSSKIGFTEPNGTYRFSVGIIPDFSATPSSGIITINGSSYNVNITFVEVTYSVTFSEYGLPSGTMWTVDLSGSTESSSTSSIYFNEPNGTYNFTVGSIPGYQANPKSGSIMVNGSDKAISITFTATEVTVTFVQDGLPSGTSWTVTLSGISKSSLSDIFFNITPGTYSFTITPIPGYHASVYSGNITIASNSISQTVSWTVVTYPIIVTQSGIPNGTQWSVTLTGSTFYGASVNVSYSSTTSEVVFYEPNGSYSYSIHLPTGYSPAEGKLNGSTTLSGQTTSLGVKAQQMSSNHNGTNPLEYAVIALVIIVVIMAGLMFLRRKR